MNIYKFNAPKNFFILNIQVKRIDIFIRNKINKNLQTNHVTIYVRNLNFIYNIKI